MSAKQKSDILYALRWAFPYTVPIFMGFWFIGLAYGIYMNVMGFGFLYPFFMSLLIFGGSLEFIVVPMLLAPFAPLQMILVALLIQARHLFYGVSMLDKYKGLGWKKPYLIFVMTAMFVAIFMEQWLKEKRHISAWIGLGASVICLVVFGADSFMIPSMAAILLLLTLFRKKIGEPQEEEVGA